MTGYDPVGGDHGRVSQREGVARVPAPATHDPRDPGEDAQGPPSRGALIGEHDRQAFLDILSHEMRTPVTTIYGGAELLAKHELEPDRRKTLAEDVRVEADRLYRLVEDLVILVNSERDALRPVGEPVAVGRLVSAAIEREVDHHPGVKIAFLGSSDATAEGADEEMVTHVIRNLLDNAVRYGAQAGPIEVVVEVTPAEVAVRVNDKGAAPEPDGQPFGLSTQRPVTAAARAGAGIGLYVADRLVRAMGGRMWAIRSAGHGAEFGFALARSTAALPAQA